MMATLGAKGFFSWRSWDCERQSRHRSFAMKKITLWHLGYRPISVNSQPGGQNNKIVLHLKGLFLSGEKTAIVCPPDWELLKWVYMMARFWGVQT